MHRIQQIFITSVLAAGVLGSDIDLAHANANTSVITNSSLVVSRPVEHRTLYVHHNKPTVMTFSCSILSDDQPDSWVVDVRIAKTRDKLTVYAPDKVQSNATLGHYTIGTRCYTLVLTLIAASNANDVQPAVAVSHQDMLEIVQAAARELAHSEIASAKQDLGKQLLAVKAEHRAQLDQVKREHREIQRRTGESILLTELADAHPRTRKLGTSQACHGTDIVVCAKRWTPLKTYGVLRLVVHNKGADDIEIDGVKASNRRGSRDHATMVRVGDATPVDSRMLRATVPALQSTELSVAVTNPKGLGGKIQLAISTVGRSVPAFQTIDLDPQPAEGEGLITLSFQGIAGAVWLANPVQTDQLGAAPTAGLSFRVRRGFNRIVSFEGEVAGTTSGKASFDGMMVEGEEGELIRNASLGRVLFGGVLHFGEQYRPMFRLGVGFQGVNHGSQFNPTAGPQRNGPGGDFEIAGLWSAGIGFEAKLGRHWTAGIGATFVGSATSTSPSGLRTSFEGGLYLSYGWTP